MKTRLMKVKRIYRFIPTALTLGNTLCGFGAILNVLQAYKDDMHIPSLLARSAWLIVFAMIFDMLDGWTARKLHATSSHGMQMDSLADMVTFGVAPAVMVAVMAHTMPNQGLPYRWVWVMAAIYVSCVALRLALYNVMAMEDHVSETFHGLPSPGGAAAISSLVFLYNGEFVSEAFMVLVLPFYAGVLGMLMVSSVSYFHFGKWLGSRRFYRLKMASIIIFFIFFSLKPQVVAAIAINAYVLSGLGQGIWALVKTRMKKTTE